MNTSINELANSMGVSASDVMALAMSVAGSISCDGASYSFINNEAHQVDFVNAYVASEVRKFEILRTKMLVSKEARDLFAQGVYLNLTKG